jgi:Phage terminase-like protein, large subunit
LDGENGAQIYSAAVDRDQASIVWNAAVQMINSNPILGELAKCWSKSIAVESTGSFFKPLSKETKNKDGMNPYAAICDEEHAWSTDDILNLIQTGMGARRQPLIFGITTAGFNMSNPYYTRRGIYVDILNGVKKQEDTFCIIYTLDEDDDWKDPANWYKASPNLGYNIYMDYMHAQFEDALLKGGETEVAFKTKKS